MKPEEAIEVLSNELIVITDMIGYCRDFEKESDLALAYRVKRQEAHKIAISALKEIQQYRKIGTVEECRKAVEKQKLKKPVKDKYNHNCCPNCGWIVSGEGGYGEEFCPHCENCGQAIRWENLGEMEDEEN